ncbi:MFS transporter [Nordella sp. HKS 07]|uniref:MFS transporter n=1 Tax=Nordella sp. HKS 07 TaxID=2712222 RepID=UPI0013E204EA|nr:MFS transporter [Nordella sp. HKS 07]QIG47506.1 MFS transporter [Nordella sp. HKS 07]
MIAGPNDHPPLTDWRAVAVVVAAGVVAALQVGKGIIALPALRLDFSLGLAAAGWVISIFAFLGVFLGIPAGMLVNRFGDRYTCLLGLVVLAIGSLMSAFAGSYGFLLAGRTIEGIGFLLTTVAAPALLRRIVEDSDRDFAFGLWSTYMPAGMAIALICGAGLAGWRGFWLVNAGLILLMLTAATLIIPRDQDKAGEPWAKLARDAWTTYTAAGPMLVALVFSLYSLLYFALASFLPILLGERMQVSPAWAGLLSALVIAVNILGNLAAGALLGRNLVARWTLMAIAPLIMGLTGIAIFLVPLPASVIFLLCVIFSGVGGLLPATAMTTAPLLAPEPRLTPMSLGLIVQGSNLGQVVGPVTVGAAVDWAGWPAAAWPVATAALLALLLTLWLRAFPPMRRSI